MSTKKNTVYFSASNLVTFAILVFYLISHLAYLTNLPVFADEAIYIRWSQLIISDAKQYLFFPLNDGKTPLFIWLMVPLLKVIANPLWAGRFLSVIIGFFQVIVSGALTKALGGRDKTTWLAMILTTILPFWFFHHRAALIDGLMTLFISLAMWSTIKFVQVKKSQRLKWLALTTLGTGLALWSKLPALLFLPTLPLYPFFSQKIKSQKKLKQVVLVAISLVLGAGLFLTLKLHPAFGQLFSRGGDFLYPTSSFFSQKIWQTTLRNIPSYWIYFATYLTLPVLFLNIYGLFARTNQKSQHFLFFLSLVFALPIILLGKVVYPRYFLPVAIGLTISAALAFQDLVDEAHRHRQMWQKVLVMSVVVLFLVNTITPSLYFDTKLSLDPDNTPFVPADKTQYLHEWSSGHGILEATMLIQNLAENQRVAVATEGRFGTLPDGILMYLFNQNVENIFVEGLGYPLKQLSPEFIDRAQNFDQVLLIINSHRFDLTPPPTKLLQEYCRPNGAPCLQVWDITSVIF